jgi:L-amino acid N-acyltransferase YncA
MTFPEGRMRFATPADAAQVQAIYAPYVRDTTISFELEPPGVDEMAGRIAATLATHPWLVMESGGRVAGYAYASRHRDRLAYQWSADVSCYVDPAMKRRGIGKALYLALLAILREQGFRNAYAGIALPNPSSVGLHEAVGFTPLGVYRGVGFKRGAWHDVGWWECRLGELPAEPRAPTPLAGLLTLRPGILDHL